MPTNREMTEEEQDIFREGAGTRADTKNRKELNYKFFVKYILKREKLSYENLDDAELTAAGEQFFTSVSNEKIGKYFIEYFQSLWLCHNFYHHHFFPVTRSYVLHSLYSPFSTSYVIVVFTWNTISFNY